MTAHRQRVKVMHGVNLDMLGRRDPEHYGSLTLAELEARIASFAGELGLATHCLQTNSEAEFVEHLHRAPETADALILNPGAWTHYAFSIRDALEIAALPAVEVHLSDIAAREPWRAHSVIRELCLMSVSGLGAEGYRRALARLATELGG